MLLTFPLHLSDVVEQLVAYLQLLKHFFVESFDVNEMLELLVLAVQLVPDVNCFWFRHWCAF